MEKKLHKYSLRDKETKKFLLEANASLGINIEQFFGSKIRIEVLKNDMDEIFILNGRLVLARFGGTLFFTLTFTELFSQFPRIVVDMGAVPYVCNGADVMAPGVLSIIGDFKEGALLIVVDERHNRPLAVGTALFNSEEMKNKKHGKSVKIIHYIGDRLWQKLRKS